MFLTECNRSGASISGLPAENGFIQMGLGIGQRKAYEYFLGPLLKYQNESLRER